MARDDAVKQATGEAFFEWLESRPLFYMRDLIEGAVKAATKEWLDQHGHELFSKEH